MIDTSILAAARAVAGTTGVCAAALVAVARIETDAVAFAPVAGAPRPLIRFEGHWFDRLLDAPKRQAARAAGLAHPRAGTVRNPRDQAGRWRLLEAARAIDADAANAAVSWGLGQVMGLHWRRLGFTSSAALAAAAEDSAEGQFRILAAFLALDRLDALLPAGRFADFAKSYNGPNYAANRYDAKLRAAYAEAVRLVGAVPAGGSAAAPPAPAADAGWARPAGGLFAKASWIIRPRRSTRTATRSSSTSTEPSSALPTTPPPSG